MIKIEELDEFEGLTADMVRAWLRAKGFTLKQVKLWSVWVRETEAVHDHLLTETVTLEYLAAVVAQRSPQSLLCEINPRMRAGWPSEEEIKGHRKRGGLWLCLDDEGPAIVVGRFISATRFRHTEWLKKPGVLGFGIDKEFGSDLKFWPCDQHGNKTRRGA